MKKNMLYNKAIQWIANNDEPNSREIEEISFMISVVLVADIFEKNEKQVAQDVLKLRERK